MSGTTLCPHCGTRFKIGREQLEAHYGLVRCGNCHQAFDPLPDYVPEEIDPQLELPILDDTQIAAPGISASNTQSSGHVANQLDTMPTRQDIIVSEPYEVEFLSKRSSRLWMIPVFPLLLLLIAQVTFLFRVELAANVPQLKPWLIRYCKLLKCSVPLPQKASLISIESSELKDEPTQRNQIILVALLRNRAAYTQAYPNLELTLTDLQDNALARRIFKPEDYLAASRNIATGFPGNQELDINLRLDTTDLKPVGYRLALYY